MQNDLSCPLRKLKSPQHMGLISQMVEIQKYKLDNEKSMQWYKATKYLASRHATQHHSYTPTQYENATDYVDKLLVRRQCDDTVPIRSVLSVSYTWQSSEFEDQHDLDFQIVEDSQTGQKKSEVRSSIISRVLSYIKSCHLPGFWVDKDCINQKDDNEKSIAIQSMDLIYRFGDYSVAFLTTPIRTTYQARLLSKLMLDKWICQKGSIGRIKLKKYVRVREAQAMISLLERILSDPWWTRAWTYHEEYCASTKMFLLIPHSICVSKDQKYSFGDIAGEIRLRAVSFREQVTRFCLAHTRKFGDNWQEGSAQCRKLLSIAARHKVIEEHKKERIPGHKTGALSWRIIHDLKEKRLSNPWEILAIIANCCGYSMRLDPGKLRKAGYSLSAAVLALALLNGEILHNDDVPMCSANVNLFELVDHLAFQNFDSMVDAKELTFLKRCRFSDVSIRHDGVLTTGCIWVLHKPITIPAVTFESQQEIGLGDTTLSKDERRQLSMLCKRIKHKCPSLTNSIRNFMEQVKNEQGNDRLPSMVLMARNLIRSIQQRRSLAIGSLVGRTHCQGIFVVDGVSSHCFTAWQPRVRSESLKADRYLEKNISLGVECLRSEGTLKRLKTLRWMKGLCFFDRIDQRTVLFPWSASLKQLEFCS